MPIYEYRCRDCEEVFEKLVRVSTPADEVACPQCGQHHAERLLSGFATQGVGFSYGGGGGSSSSCGSSGFG